MQDLLELLVTNFNPRFTGVSAATAAVSVLTDATHHAGMDRAAPARAAR